MKTLLVAVFAVVMIASVAAVRSTRAVRTQEPSAPTRPWEVGQCYRVSPTNRDTWYTFKVLEPPSGPWVRVMSVPVNPSFPGGKPQVTQWLNSGSTFVVQEWTCPQ
jgi:hypothetical protein